MLLLPGTANPIPSLTTAWHSKVTRCTKRDQQTYCSALSEGHVPVMGRLGRISGDETALERRDYLCRFVGALPRASRNVPPNGADDREPFQRGLAGVCCRVDEVGAGARGKGKACWVRNGH